MPRTEPGRKPGPDAARRRPAAGRRTGARECFSDEARAVAVAATDAGAATPRVVNRAAKITPAPRNGPSPSPPVGRRAADSLPPVSRIKPEGCARASARARVLPWARMQISPPSPARVARAPVSPPRAEPGPRAARVGEAAWRPAAAARRRQAGTPGSRPAGDTVSRPRGLDPRAAAPVALAATRRPVTPAWARGGRRASGTSAQRDPRCSAVRISQRPT